MTPTELLSTAQNDYNQLLGQMESRIAALPNTASPADVDAIETEFRGKLDTAETRLIELKTRNAVEARIAEARRASAGLIPSGEIHVGAEAHTYSADDPTTSFISDLYRARHMNDRTAEARLEHGTRETLVDAERAGHPIRDREGRALSSTGGAGGDFLPPLYFGDLYAEFKRARRVTAELVRNMQLSAHGNTITVPRITGGTATSAQQDNQNVENEDAETAIITVPVCTIAGYIDLSRQVVERSEPGLDQLMFRDLLSDYNMRLNRYVVYGTGSGGQPTGILNTSGVLSLGYTDSSPTVAEFYPRIVDAVRQVNENVFEPATGIVMTARRWAWILSAVDSTGRPLVVPNGQGSFNELGVLSAGQNGPFGNNSDSISPAGTLAGLPVYIDECLPKTIGTGTNQDPIIVAAWQESILWEDRPRMFTFSGVTSQTASIRCQIFGYAAFTAQRFPTSIAVITGTGLAAPSFGS